MAGDLASSVVLAAALSWRTRRCSLDHGRADRVLVLAGRLVRLLRDFEAADVLARTRREATDKAEPVRSESSRDGDRGSVKSPAGADPRGLGAPGQAER